MFETCRETVSILYALIFGAGDACINISAGSVLSAFAAFMVVVVVAQYLARKLWSGLTNTTPPRERRDGTIYSDAADDDDKFKDSAVWSRKR